MRGVRRPVWTAAIVSVFIHAIFVGVFFAFLPDSPSSPRYAGSPVNMIIEAPDDPTVTGVRLDDAPNRVSPETMRQEAVKSSPVRSVENHDGAAVVSASNAIAAVNSAIARSANTVSATNQSSPAPLHGPLKAGQSVVYVLDCSGSMGQQRKLGHAIAVLKESLKNLDPGARFQMVTYDSRATVLRLSEGLALSPANPANIRQAECRLGEVTGEGSSRHAEGLRAGLAFHPSMLILITDADELSPKDAQALKKWNTTGTIIHAVVIGSPESASVTSLRELTGERGTQFISLPESPPLMP